MNFDRDLNYVVGWEALDADRTMPEGTVLYPKRGLGTPTQYAVHDRSLTPELVCSLILRSLRRNAEEHLGWAKFVDSLGTLYQAVHQHQHAPAKAA